MKTQFAIAVCGGIFFSTWLPAATRLFDFESDADLAALKWASQGQSRLEHVARFATAGNSALMFASPMWKQGMPEWPAFEAKPAVTNWTGYDRLVLDITNPGEERFHFALFISDSKVPFRKGLAYTFSLPSRGYQRFEVPLSAFPREVNRAEIAILHFFTQRPPADLSLHLDNITLLRQGETMPEPGLHFAKELGSLTDEAIQAAEQTIRRSRETAQPFGTTAALRQSARTQFDPFDARLKKLRAELASVSLNLAQLNRINAELAALPGQVDRTLSVIRFQKACSDAGLPASNLLVGMATSMEKILPREMPFDLGAPREVEVSLARNEKESFQLLVLPVSRNARQVTVGASDLASPEGAVFRRGQIQCDVVGYVETKARPPYGTPHIGWWPDPILDFLGPVDIAAGDLQAFWIRLRAPKDQPPGTYRGTITVTADGVAQATLGLKVKVRTFSLPAHSPLPVAITFSPHDYPADEKQPLQGEWRHAPDYPVNAWKQHKMLWADMLADYYINYDSLYRHGPPDFEVLQRLHSRGQLVAFNLGIFDAASRGGVAASNAFAGLRVAYDRAQALGMLDHAYIYGFDECKPEMFPLLEKTAQTLRREFPGVLLMTTSYDHSYGMDTVAKTVDAWCPLTPSFKPDQAARARAAGRQVWWYICCGPHHPHGNMFIEYPAIEGRLLMGAMTAKQRPDGFLYYQISIWNSRKPITSGPFTDWDPRSWTTYHGDGSWTCVGPGGRPLPTVRLENFRDGLEDYAYARVLESTLARIEASAEMRASRAEWISRAKVLLEVPAEVVKSMTSYTRDPAVLYRYRDSVAEAIESAGIPPVDPWAAGAPQIKPPR